MPVPHVVGATFQVAAGPPYTPRIAGAHDRWQEYTERGGAAADDARHVQLVKEQQRRSVTPSVAAGASSVRLIEVSPEKKTVSKNTDLLIDLNFDVAPEAESRRQSYAIAASADARAITQSTMSLLD